MRDSSARRLLVVCIVLTVSAGCTSASNPNDAPVAPTPQGHAVPRSSSEIRPRGYTGIDLQRSASVGLAREIIPDYSVIIAVAEGSPAEKAGLAVGDVILEVNGRDARGPGSKFFEPGVTYVLRIRRGKAEREVTLVAVPQPPAGR
jgi:C-terminal processing protease CtpA/Prc